MVKIFSVGIGIRIRNLTTSKIMENCVFCNIVAGKSPETTIDFENDEMVVFKDIRPASENHYLAVSKVHIESAKILRRSQENLVINMEEALKTVLQEKGANLNDVLIGFHYPPFITVRHLHMHGIAPASTMGFLHRLMFRQNSFYFRSPQRVRNELQPDS